MFLDTERVIYFKSLFVALCLLVSETTYSHNKVVVIPLIGDDIRPISNVITVAKTNGDFNNPVDAVNSIRNASESNPYLVVIAPGEYRDSRVLQMKEYVNIIGSGTEVTRLVNSRTNKQRAARKGFGLQTGNFNYVIAVAGADNAAIEGLTIAIDARLLTTYGVYNNGVSPRIENVNIVDLSSSSRSTLCYGIYNRESSPKIQGVSVTFNTCVNRTTAIANHRLSFPLIVDSEIYLQGLGNGIDSEGGSVPKIRDSTVGSNSVKPYCGVRVYEDAGVKIIDSELFGTHSGLCMGFSNEVRVIGSMISKGISEDAEGIQCSNTYDEGYSELNC